MQDRLLDEIRHHFHPDTHPEKFEDGYESFFSQWLESFVLQHGNLAVILINVLIIRDELNYEFVGEALRWMGWITDERTHEARFKLLVRCLSHQRARVRDAAGLGLSSLRDISAIPFVRSAYEIEKVSELKEDLKQVLDYLMELTHV